MSHLHHPHHHHHHHHKAIRIDYSHLQNHRSKKRRTNNDNPTTIINNPDLLDYHHQPSPSSSASASSRSSSSSSRNNIHPEISNLPLRTRLRSNSKSNNTNHRVLSPLPPNACLSRKFVTVPNHLHRLCDKLSSNDHQISLKLQTHHQILQSRPLCKSLSTDNIYNNNHPTNRKRKRNSNKLPSHPNQTNENSRQVMVLINHPSNSSSRLTRSQSQSDIQSRSSSSSPSTSSSHHETDVHHQSNNHSTLPYHDFYLSQASKSQLLRLKRDQLIQLIKLIPKSKHRDQNIEQSEELDNKNKESLAGMIIDSRTRHCKFTFQPSQSSSSSMAGKIDRPEDLPGSSSQPFNTTRSHTCAKSLAEADKSIDSRSYRRNGTCITRSQSRQRKISDEPNSVPTTRLTRSATQVDNRSGKTRTKAEGSHSSSRVSSSSWNSSPSAANKAEQLPTRTPRRQSNRRKAVKFTSGRSCGPTPIAYRTRRSSNHRQGTKSSANTSSGIRRNVYCRSGSRKVATSRVSTPTRSTRKLRNGKVIRLQRQMDNDQDEEHSDFSTEQPASDGDEEAQTEDEDDDRATNEEDGGEENVGVEGDEEEDNDELQSGSENEVVQLDAGSDIDIVDDESDENVAVNSDDEVTETVGEEDDAQSDDIDSFDIASEDDEGGEEDDEMIDLAQATSKGLLRLKRDNLVRLCEEREIEAQGTKKHLVKTLLAWRGTNENISPSSDICEESPPPSVISENGSIASAQVAATNQADGTCSRPIILDSESDQKPEKTQIKTPVGSKVAAQKKDDIGELLDLESLNLQDKEIQADQLKKMELIGSGGFKDVYRGMYKKVPVALAEIRGHLTEMDLKELRILRDLRHENIVRFIGVSVPSESSTSESQAEQEKVHIPITIVTEICTNGDLFDYIRKIPSPGFLKICQIFRDICRGLDYLHSHVPVIIHRDLKSSNVLITAKGVAKLNDFGLARIKNSTRSMVKSLVGTVNWQAPELWVPHPRYNEKVDVYSAGLVLWEMLQWHQPVKRYPFEGQNEHAIYQDVGQRQLRPATAGMRRQWGDEILNLVEKLWAQNPHDRPRMGAVIKELEQIVAQFKNSR